MINGDDTFMAQTALLASSSGHVDELIAVFELGCYCFIMNEARALLAQIKNKYDGALSCGDLMVLSGYDAAILLGGGPLNHVCASRIDQINSRMILMY